MISFILVMWPTLVAKKKDTQQATPNQYFDRKLSKLYISL